MKRRNRVTFTFSLNLENWSFEFVSNFEIPFLSAG